MVTIALLEFEKRRNSTLRPDIFTADNLFQGEIKGNFTPEALEITFNFSDPSNLPKYNYAYIYPFNRFYFIRSWNFVGGLWVASFVVDVLATYRTTLQRLSGYCVRSENFRNTELIDGTYPTQGGASHFYRRTPARTFWGNDLTAGSVVAGIVGSSGYNLGAVTYYAMPYTVFRNFMSRLLTGISWADISTDEISEELQKALINPAQYIVSCVWLPISVSEQYGALTNTIKLGWWSFTLTGNAVALTNPTRIFRKTVEIDIPKHPEADTKGAYLNLSPYSRYTLKFLPFGVFEIDSTHIVHAEKLFLHVTLNPMTGDAVLDVGTGDSGNLEDSIITSQACCGVQIPTGQISANLGNMDQALLAGAVVGAQDLVNAFTSSVNQGTVYSPTGKGGGGQTAPGLGGGRK